jgi:RND family efflux transporter MFP subunit
MNPATRWLVIVAAFAALGLTMAWSAGLFTPSVPAGVVDRPGSPAGGEAVPVTLRTRARVETATGTVEAGYEAVISPRITATVLAAPVRAGADVAAGQLLFELDARELEARVAQAREAVQAARARRDDAARTAERMAELLERGAVSVAENDRARAALEVAAAELQRAADALDEAETARSFARIEAPLAGRLVDRFVDAGDTVAPGVPMARLYDPDRLRLEADVRESLAELLRELEVLDVRIDALDRTVSGRVEEIVPSADPGSRTFVVKVGLPADPALFPGMFGRLAIPVGEERVFLVPERAVRRVGQLEFVQVPGDEGTERRYVRTGSVTVDGLIEVRAGLEAGEQVLVP